MRARRRSPARSSALPGVTTVRLDRLDDVVVGALVDAAGAAGLPAWDTGALVAESEGLPLYVVEALAAGPGADGHAPPRGVRALMRERLASVGEAASQVLAAAAVIGRSFDLATVRAASGRAEEETVTALEELVRRGIVREVASGGDLVFDFGHASLRDAAYDGIGLARRRLLHRRAAEVLRAGLGGRDDPGRLVQIAGHEQAAGHGRRLPPSRTVRPAWARGASMPTGRRCCTSRPPSPWVTRTSPASRSPSGRCERPSETTRGRSWRSRPLRVSSPTRTCPGSSCDLDACTAGAGTWPRPRATSMRRWLGLMTGSGRRSSSSGAQLPFEPVSSMPPPRWRERRWTPPPAPPTRGRQAPRAGSWGWLRSAGAPSTRHGRRFVRAVVVADEDADGDPEASIAARNGLALVEAAAGDGEAAIALPRGGAGRVPADR